MTASSFSSGPQPRARLACLRTLPHRLARLLDVMRHFAGADKPIAAICHGAQILTAADVVRGKRVSAYPAVGPEVISAGASS